MELPRLRFLNQRLPVVVATIWVFPKNRGGPPKWMVKIMENPIIKMDDFGVPSF